MVTETIDSVDKELLNLIQTEFPLVAHPYQEIAAQLGLDEFETQDRISRLKKLNVVRQISAIFDTRKLGYKTTLVAFRYPEHLLDGGARIINKHPGVSHNYAREGYFNLWFTLAVPSYDDLDSTIEEMARVTEAESFRIMPTIRFFKIGVNFDMVRNRGAAHNYYSPDGFGNKDSGSGNPDETWNTPIELTSFEIDVIRELQEDLPVESSPFEAMASRLGLTVERILELAEEFQDRGFMRRFSAVLYHRKAGFGANAMVVWKVPEERAIEVGMAMAKSPWVTHCYQRPTFPDWPYTHFSMIHAKEKSDCERVAEELSTLVEVTDYQLLYSTREYKKTRVRYFVEDKVTQ